MKTPRVLPKCNLSTTHVHFWILMKKRENTVKDNEFLPILLPPIIMPLVLGDGNISPTRKKKKRKSRQEKVEYRNARRENLCAETHTFFACPPCVCTLFYSISLAGPRITLSCFGAACARAKPFFGCSWWCEKQAGEGPNSFSSSSFFFIKNKKVNKASSLVRASQEIKNAGTSPPPPPILRETTTPRPWTTGRQLYIAVIALPLPDQQKSETRRFFSSLFSSVHFGMEIHTTEQRRSQDATGTTGAPRTQLLKKIKKNIHTARGFPLVVKMKQVRRGGGGYIVPRTEYSQGTP